MFLAVDAGNTHIVLGLFEGEALERTWRLSANPARTEDEYRPMFRRLFEESGVEPASVRGCMISSVVPKLAQTLWTVFDEMFGDEPLLLNNGLDLGFQIRYHHPEDVGADRLANAAGGIARYGAPLIVVDLGTATTFDVISADSAYLGGVIMPGLEMSADVLFRKTSLLPRVSIELPKGVVGRTTLDAINSGLVLGAAGAIDRLVDRIRAELGAPECLVVATGGYSRIITDLSERLERIDPDLTLFGILKIWQRASR